MNKHKRTSSLINELIKQLASGTNIVLDKKRLNIYPYLPKHLRDRLPKTQGIAITKQILRYVRQQNLITIHDHPKGQIKLRLTDSGVQRTHKITMQELSIPRPPKWDRKWRLVFFDIPEAKRGARNRLVLKLKDLGFYQLQRSIWVHPYPCHIEIEYLKQSYGLSQHVYLAEAYRIDKQNMLMHKFRGFIPQKRLS